MKIRLDEGAYESYRAHPTDAGLDIRAMESACVFAHSFRAVHTGVHVQLPHGTAGLLVSRSGLNIRHGITTTGLIDEGYTGEILVSVINHGDENYHIHAGDRISQLVVIPVRYEPVELVDEITGAERGANGYGSTGR